MTGLGAIFDALTHPAITRSVTLTLAVLLGWAGAYKIYRPYFAALALQNFKIMNGVSKWAARGLGFVEVAAAILLIIPVVHIMGAVLSGVLSFGFSLVIFLALRRGETFACSCFGRSDGNISGLGLLRSILMMTAAVIAIFSGPLFATAGADWLDAAALSCVTIGLPMAERARRQVVGRRRELQEILDWEWIVQQHRAAVDPDPVPVQKERA